MGILRDKSYLIESREWEIRPLGSVMCLVGGKVRERKREKTDGDAI